MNGVTTEGTLVIIFGYLTLFFYIIMGLTLLYLVVLAIKALKIYIKEHS